MTGRRPIELLLLLLAVWTAFFAVPPSPARWFLAGTAWGLVSAAALVWARHPDTTRRKGAEHGE